MKSSFDQQLTHIPLIKFHWIVWICLVVGFCMFVMSTSIVDPGLEKIDNQLLSGFGEGEKLEALILLNENISISEKAGHLKSKSTKGAYVFQTLKTHATQRQKIVLKYLIDHKIPYKAFSIINAVYIFAEPDEILALSKFREVKYIARNTRVKHHLPKVNTGIPERSGPNLPWGLTHINADSVWALGYEGQNVVIGGQDTGYDWEHPALKKKYRGWDGDSADHNYNWHDAIHAINILNQDSIISSTNNPCGLDTLAPCDDRGHGTHTMGTMVGSDSTQIIGVAPKAKWIGCRNMERGYGSPATYLECFEWFLAPTDLNNENPDPAKAPHIINNSWSCPPLEGCLPENFNILDDAIKNLRSAGILVVVSAGNTGSGCASVSNPPAMFESSLTIGAIQDNDTIAGFSSRGPVLRDSSGRIKPDLTAPGVGVFSTRPGGKFGFASGTSMAGPHAAGVAALLISAKPDMAGNIDSLESVLTQSARPQFSDQDCGDISGQTLPNHTYGYGIINALAAIELVTTTTSVHPDLEEKTIQVSPNPFSNRLQISNVPDHARRYRLLSVHGAVLIAGDIGTSHFVIDFNAYPYAQGIYFLQIEFQTGIHTVKLIKI